MNCNMKYQNKDLENISYSLGKVEIECQSNCNKCITLLLLIVANYSQLKETCFYCSNHMLLSFPIAIP